MNPSELNFCAIINQIFEIEKKVKDQPQEKTISRNLRRIHLEFENLGYKVHNPMGEAYDPTRLDCEAMTSGTEGIQNLKIVEVIKPIIYLNEQERNTIVQKAVVIVS